MHPFLLTGFFLLIQATSPSIIIHPNRTFRNSKIARTQVFFERAVKQDRPMRIFINSVIKPDKDVWRESLQLEVYENQDPF